MASAPDRTRNGTSDLSSWMWSTMHSMFRPTLSTSLDHALAVPQRRPPNEMALASTVAPRRPLIANRIQPLILTFTSIRFLTTRRSNQPVVHVLAASPLPLVRHPSPSQRQRRSRHPQPPKRMPSELEFRQATRSRTGIRPRLPSSSWAVCSMPTRSASGSTTGRFSTTAHRLPWPTWQATCGCC